MAARAAAKAAKVALDLTPAQIRQILRLAGKTYKGRKAPKLTSGAMRKARRPGAAVKQARKAAERKEARKYDLLLKSGRSKAARDRALSAISPAYGRRVKAQKAFRKAQKTTRKSRRK